MKVNEIFYSLQGEGHYTGVPSVFVRLSGCNLRCAFCDTAHESGDELTEEEVVARVAQYEAKHVVVTGGEPSMFLTSTLVDALHQKGKFVAVETNGTHLLPDNVDWITLSPKFAFFSDAPQAARAQVVLPQCDELKAVFLSEDSFSQVAARYEHIAARFRYLQPCDVGDAARNAAIRQAAVAYCLEHPHWSLSLQTHKLLQIR